MSDHPSTPANVQAWLALAQEADAGLRGKQPGVWLDRLEAQHTQLTDVLGWCMTHGRSDAGLEIAAKVWPFWLQRNHLAEGRQWLSNLLAAQPTGDAPLLRARALAGAGALAFFQADSEESAARLEESLALCEQLGDAAGMAEAHSGLSRVAMARGQPGQMRRHSQAALELARAHGIEAASAIALHHLAHAALMDGDLAEAERRYAQNIETYRGMGRDDLVVSELHNLAHVACLRGQTERARPLFIESLEYGEQTGHNANRPYNLMGLGRVAYALGRPAAAAVLLSAGLAMLQAQGKAIVPLLRPEIERVLAETRAAMPDAEFEAAAARAASLSSADAIRMANEL